jgi:hypothetical protein
VYYRAIIAPLAAKTLAGHGFSFHVVRAAREALQAPELTFAERASMPARRLQAWFPAPEAWQFRTSAQEFPP